MPFDPLYFLLPVMLLVVVLAAVMLDRLSVPVILIALGFGLLFGVDGFSVLPGDISGLAAVANLALVFILFYGGFCIRASDLRTAGRASLSLATAGVLLTAGTTFALLHFLFRWPLALSAMLAAIVSSTDAAATFSILDRQPLPEPLASVLSIESAANDPMAVLLALLAIGGLGRHGIAFAALRGVWQFVGGTAFGVTAGLGTLLLFRHIRPRERGHYYVLFLSLVLLAYGLAEGARASGILAVFVAGVVLGNRTFVFRQCIDHFASAVSTIANLAMFLLLGLYASPHDLGAVWWKGAVLFAVLSFAARPLAVFVSTAGMGLGTKEKLFASWAGLRGAVPIVLATYPAAAGLEGADEVFNIVFVAVILSILLQGSTLGLFARFLGLKAPMPVRPLYSLELVSLAPSDLDLFTIDLPQDDGDGGSGDGPLVRDLRLPPESIITMIVRGATVIAPKGDTRLKAGDRLTLLARATSEPAAREALLSAFYDA
ncbi:MAG: potassium/proton antiporter [Kiritimatiellae bacterium]|nr:potassium/proton antiporter [Kiritimatiellia bacterium]